MNTLNGVLLVIKALMFAIWAHWGQKRKYTGLPYVLHPMEVAWIVFRVKGSTWEMVAAALLHDVVEDCEVSFDTIRKWFGQEVYVLVEGLTDISTPEYGNRAKRKALDRVHTEMSTPNTKTIKLADLISNSRSIEKHDKDFAVVYMKEKNALLDVLHQGDRGLFKQAVTIVNDYYFRTKVG